MFERDQYLVEEPSWKVWNKKSRDIKGIDGNVLGSFESKSKCIAIKDVDGVTQGEVQNLVKRHLELAVFDSQHGLRGTIKQTKEVWKGLPSIPNEFEIKDPQGGQIALLEASAEEMRKLILRFKAPDRGLVADVHPSSTKGIIRIDILKPGFDPLFVLAFVTWFIVYPS